MKLSIVLQTTILLLFSAVHITSAAAVELLEDTGPGKSAVMPVPEDSYGQVQPLKIEPTRIRKVTVTAEGCAKIYGGKVEQARLTALRMAYAEAVQSTVGIEIRNLSITKNVKQVSDIVLARSKGFIRTYKLVREGISEKDSDLYEVTIDADVIVEGSARGSEREGLQLYLKLIGDPKILILLGEESNGSTRGSSGGHMTSAEAALAQAFGRYGYQVMTSDDISISDKVAPGSLENPGEGMTHQGLQIAKSIGADIILTGVIRTSQTRVKPYGVAVFNATAEASAKAIIVSSGRVIHIFHQTERTSAYEPLQAYTDALDRIADGAVDVLAWKIPQVLTAESHEMLLRINGIGSLENAHRIRDAFLKAPEIEGVRYSRLPTTKSNTLEILLLTGFVRPVPEEIVENCEKALGRKLSIVASSKYQLELQ